MKILEIIEALNETVLCTKQRYGEGAPNDPDDVSNVWYRVEISPESAPFIKPGDLLRCSPRSVIEETINGEIFYSFNIKQVTFKIPAEKWLK